MLVQKRLERAQQQNFMGYLSFRQVEESVASACEPEGMVQLEENCRNVVRQCTSSLEANVSAQQFALVERELISSLCSYLTCDHYNDDLFTDESVVSTHKPPFNCSHQSQSCLLFGDSHAKCPSLSSLFLASSWPVASVSAIISFGPCFSMVELLQPLCCSLCCV